MNYLAIITHSRSGSTALQHALNSHEDVIVRGENMGALQGLYACHHSLIGANAHGGTSSTHPWFGSHLLDSEELLLSMRQMVCDHILRPEPHTRFLGFKEIRNTPEYFVSYGHFLDHLVFLSDLLPGIRFLINKRDPRTTAQSAWWPTRQGALQLLETSYGWLTKAGGDLDKRLGRPAAVHINYEDWDNRPEALEHVWSFLGIPWQAERVRQALSTRLTHCKT